MLADQVEEIKNSIYVTVGESSVMIIRSWLENIVSVMVAETVAVSWE